MKRLVRIDSRIVIEVTIADFEKYTTQELIDRFHKRQNIENNDCVKYRGGYDARKNIPLNDLQAYKDRKVTSRELAEKHNVSVTTVRNCLIRAGL
ncbi:MAG: hypothetical protein ACRCUJ_06595 [Phocaeicola sp.]